MQLKNVPQSWRANYENVERANEGRIPLAMGTESGVMLSTARANMICRFGIWTASAMFGIFCHFLFKCIVHANVIKERGQRKVFQRFSCRRRECVNRGENIIALAA